MERLRFERFEWYVTDNKKYYIADLVWHENDRIAPHTHDFYELFVVLQG